jgi:hypothetical protein
VRQGDPDSIESFPEVEATDEEKRNAGNQKPIRANVTGIPLVWVCVKGQRWHSTATGLLPRPTFVMRRRLAALRRQADYRVSTTVPTPSVASDDPSCMCDR